MVWGNTTNSIQPHCFVRRTCRQHGNAHLSAKRTNPPSGAREYAARDCAGLEIPA